MSDRARSGSQTSAAEPSPMRRCEQSRSLIVYMLESRTDALPRRELRAQDSLGCAHAGPVSVPSGPARHVGVVGAERALRPAWEFDLLLSHRHCPCAARPPPGSTLILIRGRTSSTDLANICVWPRGVRLPSSGQFIPFLVLARFPHGSRAISPPAQNGARSYFAPVVRIEHPRCKSRPAGP